MRKKYHRETEIVRILRDAETSVLSIQEYARSKNISEQTFYHWCSKYGNMAEPEVKRLKQLEIGLGTMLGA